MGLQRCARPVCWCSPSRCRRVRTCGRRPPPTACGLRPCDERECPRAGTCRPLFVLVRGVRSCLILRGIGGEVTHPQYREMVVSRRLLVPLPAYPVPASAGWSASRRAVQRRSPVYGAAWSRWRRRSHGGQPPRVCSASLGSFPVSSHGASCRERPCSVSPRFSDGRISCYVACPARVSGVPALGVSV